MRLALDTHARIRTHACTHTVRHAMMDKCKVCNRRISKCDNQAECLKFTSPSLNSTVIAAGDGPKAF